MKIPTYWKKITLDHVIIEMESGSRPKGGASSDTGDIPSLGGENIAACGGITLLNVKKVPENFYRRMTKGLLKDGDVLINKDGAQTGKVGYYQSHSPEACINEHLFLLRGKVDQVNQTYLYYILLSGEVQNSIRMQISGSAQPGLKASFTKYISVILPTLLTEQAKIAEILSTVDRAIEQTEALIAKQQRIKTGLMQDLLTRGIDEDGNIRTEETHEFKDSPLGRIPVEWEVKYINEIGSIFTGTTPSTFNHAYWNGEIIWVTPHDLSKLATPYLVNSEKRITMKGLKNYSLNLLPTGSIIISSRAPIGYMAISKVSFCTNQGCKSINLKEEFIPEFVYYNMLFNIQRVKRLGEGTTFAEISKDALSAVKLAIPASKHEQTGISSMLSALDLGIKRLRNNYKKLRSLKTALMQDLLTGKVRVKLLLDESEVSTDERG